MKRLILIAMVVLMSAPIAQAQDFCKGDFDYDDDVDADDVEEFLNHFGRFQFNNPCPSDGPSPVSKTGQTTSYAIGDDGDLQRGVALVSPRFTDNNDGTVTDNQTGLIWLKEANCFGLRNWNEALTDCNGLASGSCGLTDGSNVGDWRLPSKKELISLTQDDYYNPALPNTTGTGQWSEGDPFTNVQSFRYGSSTTCAFDTDFTWNVYVSYGEVSNGLKSNNSYLWPVRGGH